MPDRTRVTGLLVLFVVSSMFGTLWIYRLFAQEVPYALIGDKPTSSPAQERKPTSERTTERATQPPLRTEPDEDNAPTVLRDTVPMFNKVEAPGSLGGRGSTPEQLEKDPVFLELKKAFMSAPSSSAAEPAMVEPQKHTNIRWHAVENLLSAARLLESDARQQMERNEVEECNRTLKAIQLIRSQALELLK